MDLQYRDRKNVDAAKHQTNYFMLSDGGLYFERTQQFETAGSRFDVFPGIWGLYLIDDVPPGLLSLRTQGRLIDLKGPTAVFVRPFSLVEWIVHEPLEAPWKAICYRTAPPTSAPPEASLFQLDSADQPHSLSEICTLFQQKRDFVQVEKFEDYNILALKLKRQIDENFSLDKGIPEYAIELGINPSTLTRYFKKCYGLAPIEYRNHLRLFRSMMSLILDSKNVIDVSSEAGFNNLRNFNKQFLKYTSLRPSHLK